MPDPPALPLGQEELRCVQRSDGPAHHWTQQETSAPVGALVEVAAQVAEEAQQDGTCTAGSGQQPANPAWAAAECHLLLFLFLHCCCWLSAVLGGCILLGQCQRGGVRAASSRC